MQPAAALVFTGLVALAASESNSTSPHPHAGPAACAFAHTSERQYGIACHGIAFDLTVPAQCLNAGPKKCGVIVDVHGLTMNGTWEEALTEMSTYAAGMDAITLQPTAQPGCVPPKCSWPSGQQCASSVMGAVDDLLADPAFGVDPARLYFGGSSQGGMCTNAVMNGGNATRFAAFTVGAAWADVPADGSKHNFVWYTGRHDTFTGITPDKVEPQLAKFQQAWGLTRHELVSAGEQHEHHRWTDAARSVEVEWLVHNYTLKGETVTGLLTAGHCAPGGRDAPPNPPFAKELGLDLRLSCPQPNPKSAEEGCWAGKVTSSFYARH